MATGKQKAVFVYVCKFVAALTLFGIVVGAVVFYAFHPDTTGAAKPAAPANTASNAPQRLVVTEYPTLDFNDLSKLTAKIFADAPSVCLQIELGFFEPHTPGLDCRQVLADMAKMMCRYHVNTTCRASLCELPAILANVLPAKDTLEASMLGAFSLKTHWNYCGLDWDDLRTQTWGQCQGDHRGEFCGWWFMLHTVQLQMWRASEDDSSTMTLMPQEAAQHFRDFITLYLPCDSCIVHFNQVNTQLEEEVTDFRELVMWFWDYHNEVGQFTLDSLKEVPELYDPNWPFRPFPPPSLCSDCHPDVDQPNAAVYSDPEVPDFAAFRGLSWDRDQVFAYLAQHYRADLYTSPTANPTVAPISSPTQSPTSS